MTTTTPTSDEILIVWVPFPDQTSALSVAQSAVEARLCACVNVIPGAVSVYRWEDKIVEENEVIAVFKTHAQREDALRAWIEARHPYDVPCLASWSMRGVNDAWKTWLTAEVSMGTM